MDIIKNKNRKQFYDLTPISTVHADYNLIYGERSNGKSYAVKEHILRKFLESGEQCVLVRRYDSDLKKGLLDTYWADIKIDILSNGMYNEIYSYSGDLFVALNVNGKRTNAKKFGFSRALTLAQTYSGTQYPNVTTILLEEFVAINGTYLPNELFLWSHLISTIARRRNITVYMLANAVSRLSPYWREYSVDEVIKTQEQGTICVIDRETADGDTQKIAIEYCANTSGRSKMFGTNRGAMINEGKWLAYDQPHLTTPRTEWECLYTFVLEYKKDRFLCEYITKDNDYCIYVTPKTTPIKQGTRVISDKASTNPLHTYGLLPINRAETPIIDMVRNNKCFFSDNQTGTEFRECVKNIRKIFL